MGKSSIKYIDTEYLYKAAPVSKPVKGSVVYGKFPEYTNNYSSPDKLNKVLSSIAICFVILSLVSYYFVSDCERTMNKLGREIIGLNNENMELQNKLDNLNSVNRVSSVIQGNMMLNTAKEVIEVPAVNDAAVSQGKLMTIPVNYTWSIGY